MAAGVSLPRDASRARRLYFVQDYEPYFYATSSESMLAENTYRFGFTAITATDTLASNGVIHTIGNVLLPL